MLASFDEYSSLRLIWKAPLQGLVSCSDIKFAYLSFVANNNVLNIRIVPQPQILAQAQLQPLIPKTSDTHTLSTVVKVKFHFFVPLQTMNMRIERGGRVKIVKMTIKNNNISDHLKAMGKHFESQKMGAS